MNPDAGREIAAGILRGVRWIFIPRHGIGLGLLIGSTALGLMVLDGWLRRRSTRAKDDEVLRGARLVSLPALRRVLRPRRRGPRGIMINATMEFPVGLENQHGLAVGGTQSGKSRILAAAAASARARGLPAIIPAQEEELFEAFFDPSVDTVVNPFDARGVEWSPLAELRRAAEIPNLVQALVPVANDQTEETWRGFGRNLLAGMIGHVWSRDGTNADLRRLVVSADHDELAQVLAGSDGEALLRDGNERMLASALGTAGAVAKPLGLGAPSAGCGAWSVRRWVESTVARTDRGERCGWLWVTAPEEVSVAVMPLLSVVSSLSVTYLLRAPINRERRVFYVFDEMGSCDAVGGLERAMIRGAKRGLCVWGGVQSIPQLQDPQRYGHGAAALLGNFGSLFAFRASDPDSGAWAERNIGTHQVARTTEQESESSGANRSGVLGGQGSSSTGRSRGVNRQRVIEPAVLGSQVASQTRLECFMRIPEVGWSADPVPVDYVPLPDSGHPFFVPAGAVDADRAPQKESAISNDSGTPDLLDSLQRLAGANVDHDTG